MNNSKLPTEVELIYELMPCSSMRNHLTPGNKPHACTYFNKWGTYHSYDYKDDGPPKKEGILHETVYTGRAKLVPEALSGCRKAPIMVIGINPNLPGFWRPYNDVNPLFDDYKQYAHYFRYRKFNKLEIEKEDYDEYLRGQNDKPPQSNVELDVPNLNGDRKINVTYSGVKYYKELNSILEDLSEKMDWDRTLDLGEDLSYGNMVACPSARWTTRPVTNQPDIPPMTINERNGIVTECFVKRKYFVRQIFQSLPKVLMIVSNSTAWSFINEFKHLFVGNIPTTHNTNELVEDSYYISFGQDSEGNELKCYVIFSPHISGNPTVYAAKRQKVLDHFVKAANDGFIGVNQNTKHLKRSKGSCIFCPMLEIGGCDYEDELEPISDEIKITVDTPIEKQVKEKKFQKSLVNMSLEMNTFKSKTSTKESLPKLNLWSGSDDNEDYLI